MRLFVAAMLLVAPSVALAEDCRYVNYRDDGQTVTFVDERTFAWDTKGGTTLRCVEDDNTFARPPFPATCDNGSGDPFHVDFAYYPDASGAAGALFWLGGDIWYWRCD